MKTFAGLAMAITVCGILASGAIAHADEIDDTAKGLVNGMNNSASDSGAKYIPPVGTLTNQILQRTNPANEDDQTGGEPSPQGSDGSSGSDGSTNSTSGIVD